jgi:hypothetical protein
MIASAKEQYAGFEIAWSLDVTGGAGGKDRALELDYQVHAAEEVYVGDRLWIYDTAGKRLPDPMGVYRFVHEGSLRLVFAQAPTPLGVMPRVVFQPLFSRVEAGDTLHRKVTLALPVDEYSSLARDIKADTVLEEVTRVTLVMSYRLRSTLERDPVPPPMESADDAGYIVHDPKLAISSVEVPPLPVKRRTGPIARFVLPGDVKPAP